MPPIIVPDDAGLGDLADGYSLGAADAPVLVEVWEDFQCPYCARWTLQVEPLLIDTYVRNGQVRLTYRPLAFLGEESRWTAVAADLAAEQNRFWPFHHIVFSNHLGENVGAYGLDRLVEIGRLAGLDMDAYLDGLQLEKARARFAAIEEASQADAVRLGINATPTVVIDDRPLESPDWDSIRAAVEAALSARPAASPEG
jgi:protein-disulfide isomerase